MLRPPHVRAHQSFCMFAMSIKVAGAGQNVYVVVSRWMTTHETFHLKYFPFDRFRVRPGKTYHFLPRSDTGSINMILYTAPNSSLDPTFPALCDRTKMRDSLPQIHSFTTVLSIINRH